VPNQGIDIRGREGQTVLAAKSGRVNTFDAMPGFGKVVILEHTDRTLTCYGHNDLILVSHGRWVKQGEPIAHVGSSGELVSGIMLHFRIMKNNAWVNPTLYLR